MDFLRSVLVRGVFVLGVSEARGVGREGAYSRVGVYIVRNAVMAVRRRGHCRVRCAINLAATSIMASAEREAGRSQIAFDVYFLVWRLLPVLDLLSKWACIPDGNSEPVRKSHQTSASGRLRAWPHNTSARTLGLSRNLSRAHSK